MASRAGPGVSRGGCHPAPATVQLEALGRPGLTTRAVAVSSVRHHLSGLHRSLAGVETTVGGSQWLGGPVRGDGSLNRGAQRAWRGVTQEGI